MIRRLFFRLMYLFSDPPWDTGVTPPEVYQFLEENPPGRALDLGCGTGTNAVTLAKHGWLVTGIDFVPKAIRIARRKARREGVEDQVEFQVGNVLEIDQLEGPYDLILDIGCFQSFSGEEINRYASTVHTLAAWRGTLLIYAHLKREEGDHRGITGRDIEVLSSCFQLVSRQEGWEGDSRRSVWLAFEKGALGD